MASPLCSRKSLTRLSSESLSVVVETGGSVCWLIPLEIHELLTFMLYLCFVAGLLLVSPGSSTAPGGEPTGASKVRKESAQAGALSLSGGNMAVALPARKTNLAFPCALMLLGMPGFWMFHHQEHCLLPFVWCLTAGLILLVFLLDSAKHRFNLGVLSVMLSSTGLIHLFVLENGGSAEFGPARFEFPLFLERFEFPLFLLLLGLMGTLMLVCFGASFNSGGTVPFYSRGKGADGKGGIPASASRQQSSTSPRPAQTFMALSCAGLLHLLVPSTKGRGGPVSGEFELHVLILFLALMVSLVVVVLRISV